MTWDPLSPADDKHCKDARHAAVTLPARRSQVWTAALASVKARLNCGLATADPQNRVACRVG